MIDDELNNDELYHHGILGMRWGVRRYQNADGSLTSAGKKHYGSGNEENSSKQVSRKVQKQRAAAIKKARDTREANKELAAKKEKILRSGKPKEILKNKDLFTNEELQKAIDRFDLEKKISEVHVRQITRGQRIAMDILENSVKNIGGQTVTYLMGTAVNKTLESKFNDPSIVNPKKGQKDK